MKRQWLVFMLVFGLMSCQSQPQATEQTQQQDPMPVPIGHPEKRDVIDWDEYTGRFVSPTKVEVRARVSGFLDKVHFKDGQQVKQSDVLFTIDQDPYNIKVSLMQAQLKQVEAEALRAKNEYDRAQTLKSTDAISTEELEQRQQAMYVAEARVEAAKANLDQAKLDLEYTVVRAPVDGHVSRDLVNVGNLITGADAGPTTVTTLLTTIVADSPIHFYFEASESDVLEYQRHHIDPSINKGSGKTPIYVKLLDENEFNHQGQVDFWDNEIDPNTGTIQIRAVFDNEDGFIQPGMFGRARLPAGPSYSAVLVPDGLIRSNQSQKFVYTVNDENMVTPVNVTIGSLQTDGMRVIKDGLTLEHRIITGNTQMLRPGMPVTPQIEEEK